MARCLSRHGYSVCSTTLHDQGFGHVGVDFLTTEAAAGQMVITNPPFKLAAEFIQHCVRLQVPFALLLKSQFWHAAGRLRLFEQHRPQAVLPLTWRPDFHFGSKGGAPTMEVCWTVWGRHPAETTNYYPLNKPGRSSK